MSSDPVQRYPNPCPDAGSLRVALVSDTHGKLAVGVARAVEESDLVIHAGDVGNAMVLDLLSPRLGVVVAVAGNNDVVVKWPAGDRVRLNSLPRRVCIALPGGWLAVEHGDRFPARGRHRRLRREYPAAAAVIYGHSHRLVCDQTELPWVLNPGAGGRERAYGGPSCLLLHARRDGWRVQPIVVDREFVSPPVAGSGPGVSK